MYSVKGKQLGLSEVVKRRREKMDRKTEMPCRPILTRHWFSAQMNNALIGP